MGRGGDAMKGATGCDAPADDALGLHAAWCVVKIREMHRNLRKAHLQNEHGQMA